MSDWIDYDEGPGSRPAWMRRAVVGGAVLVLAIGGFFVARATRSDSPTELAATSETATSESNASATTSSALATTTSHVVATPTTAAKAVTTTANTVAPTSAVTAAMGPTSVAPRGTDAPSSTRAAPSSTSATASSPPSPSGSTIAGSPASTPGAGPSYATLPDGTPAPIVAVFEVDQITISGAVPSQDAKDRLQALAIANSKTPAAVANFLVIDPTVPTSIGVRVVELTSARFPEGSAEVQGAHAKELDRAASIMTALPKVTALVIGHADQVGDEQSNYVLSAERAKAVVDYLASVDGIDPARLSSRAVGESDLLTLNDDEAALALNRRTEFVFYGLLAG